MQMLERYVNEEEDEEDYYEGAGVTYNYLYDSPFDDTKDKDLLMQALVRVR